MINSSTGIESLYKKFLEHGTVTTDTRNIKEGDIFFALKGENFNGNEFALKAIEAGASYAVVDDAQLPFHERLIVVEDTLVSLQHLAQHHRRKFDIPVIAITGSNGKTTTKELVHAVLSAKYNAYTTKGNLNNHIGIPLTLLRIGHDAEIAVIEMGANHQKEIESYCTYTEPTHGMITNCGKAHLEGFGGIEGVRKGKGELFDYLRHHNGTVWACYDFDYFHDMTRGIGNLVWYGLKGGKVEGEIRSAEPFLEMQVKNASSSFIIKTQLVGAYNAYNVLAAVAIGRHFNVDDDLIKSSIENYTPSNSRSQLMVRDGNTYVLDAYNANPSSMQLAIENFASLDHKEKIVFLGGMKELGDATVEEHDKLIQLLDNYSWKKVVLVGPEFASNHGNHLHFATSTEAGNWWQQQQLKNQLVLIKGSRGIAMEKVLPADK